MKKFKIVMWHQNIKKANYENKLTKYKFKKICNLEHKRPS